MVKGTGTDGRFVLCLLQNLTIDLTSLAGLDTELSALLIYVSSGIYHY